MLAACRRLLIMARHEVDARHADDFGRRAGGPACYRAPPVTLDNAAAGRARAAHRAMKRVSAPGSNPTQLGSRQRSIEQFVQSSRKHLLVLCLALPNYVNPPTKRLQLGSSLAVSFDVAGEFILPIVCTACARGKLAAAVSAQTQARGGIGSRNPSSQAFGSASASRRAFAAFRSVVSKPSVKR